jgi:hypothetical protein
MMANYKVQKGDTLSAIGKKYGVSYQDIAKENGISNPDLIYEGQTLKITTPEQKKAGTTTSGNSGAKKSDNTGGANTNKPNTNPTAKEPAAPAAPAAPVTSPAGFTYGDFSYGAFDPMSDPQISAAWEILQKNQATRPGAYTPMWQDEADAYLSQYQNRDPFSYDFNSDALYNQYKDMYIQQGQMAMMDTMGQAAAMTGGYGNSYAQTVGQQAYNQQLSQLNNIMPELYGMAYDRYNQEGQEMLNMYDLYMNRENQERANYQTELENWYRENALLTDNYNTLYGRGWDNYILGYNTALDEYNTDRSEEFSKWQTQQSQEFTASENQKNRDEANRDREYNRLSNLISTTGYTPTTAELNAAGMTVAEVNALKKGYTASQEPKATEYTRYDNKLWAVYEPEFKRAETYAQLEDVWDRLVNGEGVDPEEATKRVVYWAIENNIPLPEQEPERKPNTGNGKVGGTGGVGGLGGQYVWAIK